MSIRKQMHRIVLLLLLLVSSVSAQSQAPYLIEGEVKNVRDGVELLLMDVPAKKQLAEGVIKNGTFRLKAKPVQGGLRHLGLLALGDEFPPAYCVIYMREGSHVKIKGEDNLINLWKVESDLKENQNRRAYLEYVKDSEVIFAQTAASTLDLQRKEIKATEAEKPSIKKQLKEVRLRNWNAQLDTWKKSIEYFKTAEVDVTWWSEVLSLAKNSRMDDFPDKEGVKALYQGLSDEHKQSVEGKSLFVILYPDKKIEDGKPMIDAELFDLQGNKHSLAELKGKFILLDFWNYSCSVCFKAIPEMKEIAEKYKERLSLVGLSTDKRDDWEAVSKKHDFTWHNWNDMRQYAGLYASYGVFAFPHYVLISPEGRILESWTGYRKGMLHDKMEQYIK